MGGKGFIGKNEEAGMMYRTGFVLFAGGHEHLEDAKEYIRKHGFTPEQVRIVKTVDQILVKTKVDLEW
jgi:hypothetical protein